MVQTAFVTAAVAITAISMGHDAQAAVSYGDPILGTGSKGGQVSALQQDLRVLGYFTYQTNTGYYGTVTEAAVKAFQRSHGLAENGKVGLTTGPLIAAEAAQKLAALAPSYPEQGIIATAKQYIGVPYRWGGTTPSGFDCSGFLGYVMNQHNIGLPRTAAQMYTVGQAVSNPRPGDLVFFSTYAPGASHAGIFLGNNEFISATSSKGVKIESMSNPYWGPRYVGARSLR